MRNLFLKTLLDKRVFIIGWSLGLAFLGFAMTTFFPSFSDGKIDDLVNGLPPALQGLVGAIQDWKQLPGYIGSQIFDIRLPILIGVLVILLAVGLSVGEEDKGQLRTLVALPLGRTRIVIAKWLAILVICFIAAIATCIGVLIGALIIGESLDMMVLVRLGFVTWIMSTALATLIFAIGMSTGYLGLTKAIGTIIIAGSFLLTTFAQSVSWLKAAEHFSLFHYFPATTVAKEGIAFSDIAVYLLITLLSLAAAVFFFRRRDVKDT
jgi:ABC-2 type transport system permease protein